MKNGPYTLIVPPQKYPGKRYRDRYAYEHHVSYWISTGKILEKGYEIHHMNGDHKDNRPENLLAVTSQEHKKIHGEDRTEKSKVELNCLTCGNNFYLKQSVYKSRLRQTQTGNIFCSKLCALKHKKSATR